MTGTVVVLTGASGGIGAATAETLARRGATLVLVGRRMEPLEELAARCGSDALAVAADVTRRDDVSRIVRDAIGRFGRIDVWINNAGQGISRMPSQLTDEDIDLMMQVNVKSALYGIQEVLPHFKARGTGHIINISSMLGRISFTPIRSAYSGSKSFLNSLTAALRTELAGGVSGHPRIAHLARGGGDRLRPSRAPRRSGLAPVAGRPVAAGSGGGHRHRDRHAPPGRLHPVRQRPHGRAPLRRQNGGVGMPLYDFHCRSCGRTFEALVRKDAPSCPHCQSTDLERLLSSFAVSSSERTQQAADKNRKKAAAAAGRDNIQMDREIEAHRRDDH